MAGYNLARLLKGKEPLMPDSRTCIGALPLYITSAVSRLQPMNANFGIIDGLDKRVKNKQERYNIIATRALETLKKNMQICK